MGQAASSPSEAHTSVYAGPSLELLRHESAALVSFRWIMGHVGEGVALADQAKRDAMGNAIAYLSQMPVEPGIQHQRVGSLRSSP